MLDFHENSTPLEVFFSGHKTANEMFLGSPELHFGCKIEIYASEKNLVTNWAQILRLKKWDQSDTWITGILWIFAKKCFSNFLRLFVIKFKDWGYIWKPHWLYFIVDPLNGSETFFYAETFAIKIEKLIFQKLRQFQNI